jgi:hypothetical protein
MPAAGRPDLTPAKNMAGRSFVRHDNFFVGRYTKEDASRTSAIKIGGQVFRDQYNGIPHHRINNGLMIIH